MNNNASSVDLSPDSDRQSLIMVSDKELSDTLPLWARIRIELSYADEKEKAELLNRFGTVRTSDAMKKSSEILSCESGTSCLFTCLQSCQEGCKSSCQDSCKSSCQDSCKSSCQDSCKSSCQSSCQSHCQSSCESNCQGTCLSHCQSGCMASCQIAGQGAGINSY